MPVTAHSDDIMTRAAISTSGTISVAASGTSTGMCTEMRGGLNVDHFRCRFRDTAVSRNTIGVGLALQTQSSKKEDKKVVKYGRRHRFTSFSGENLNV